MGRPLKIVLQAGIFKERGDGVARATLRFSQTLSEQNCPHWVFAPIVTETLERPHLNIEKVSSVPIPFYPEYRISIPTKAIERKLDRIRPDLIHIATPDLLGAAMLRYAKSRRVPVVSIYHTHFPSYLSYYHLGLFKRPLWSYLRWFYRRCDHVLAPTQAMSDILLEKRITKLSLWKRGIEGKLFHPERRDPELRRSWQVYKPKNRTR